MKKVFFFLFFLSLSYHMYCQSVLYGDLNTYNFIDTIFLGGKSNDYVKIGFTRKEGTPLILFHYNGTDYYYPNVVLDCLHCYPHSNTGSTYRGHHKYNRTVVFFQEYLYGRDSIFINFSKKTPTIKKVIRHNYTKGVIYPPNYVGHYRIVPKHEISIANFKTPIDLEDDYVKENFHIIPLKWVNLGEEIIFNR